jgi:mono/diheme cytochrome c family protein
MTWRGSVLAALLAAASPLPAGAASDLGTDEQREHGRQVYEKYCAQCHGTAGDGQGHAAPRVLPRPRDFTTGKYKFRTTPSGKLPTDDDLRRVIEKGLPYTTMPGWPDLDAGEVRDVIFHLKTFSADFANPDKHGEPIDIPAPPAPGSESLAHGRQVYEAQGCAACHGDVGRGDGASAPTLTDDWGDPIRPADLTARWTFRGGPTPQDIFRTFSTGLNGTPMPSYADSLAVEDRWDLVHYINSLGESDDPRYASLLRVAYVEAELDLAEPTLFDSAVPARFPLVGQIMQPGRDFHPPTTSVVVQAVHNRREIAFRVRWHDMRADTAGTAGPAIVVPEDDAAAGGGAEAAGEGDDFWGEAAADEGDPAVEDEGDFWGEEGEEDAAAAAGGTGFPDALALQLPSTLPAGIRKPYFIFGDRESPVDLWFVDLARRTLDQYVGRGSADLTPQAADDFEIVTAYDRGEWTVTLKRAARSTSNVTFAEGSFVPLAFSVWDGSSRERGNKRALSVWYYLYVDPGVEPAVAGPMVRAAGIGLAVELALVWLLRRRYGRPAGDEAPRSQRTVPATE